MAWFDRTYAERRGILTKKYGDPALAVPLPQETLNQTRLSKGELLLFKPTPKRNHFFYVTVGLSQPAVDDGAGDAREHEDPRRSGLGFELALATKKPDDWAPMLLLQMAAYAAKEPASLKPGVRLPFAFTKPRDGKDDEITPALGQLPQNHVPVGEIISLVIWPALELEGPFVASTGRFDLFVATGITKDEWDLAKATTSGHVIHLLAKTGNGQRTEPLRKPVTADPAGAKTWDEIKDLTKDQVLDALYGPA